MARKILWASLALAPITIFIDYVLHPGDVALFVLSALALIPLAWLIGEATEHAAHHTGPGIGGFLNATFGNAPELIIALFAVSRGLEEVVRGSLTGSVVGNLLLVLGFSLLFGGRGEIDRESSFTSLALIAVATLLFLIPSIPGMNGDPDRDSLAVLSIPISIVLLLGVRRRDLDLAAPPPGAASARGAVRHGRLDASVRARRCSPWRRWRPR